MAREYARVRVSIWADAEFRKLTSPAQALYFMLLSSATMNLAGVADWRPKRIALLASDLTEDDVRAAGEELTETSFVVIDEDSDEVLVRSFVRHDGLIKTPNIAAAMAKDYAAVSSSYLQGVIVHELKRLHKEDPEMKGWVTASHLLSQPSIDPSAKPSGNPSPKASPKASGMASVIPLENASGNGSHIPQPSTTDSSPQPTAGLSSKDPVPPTAGGETAQTLIGEWISTLRSRPPHSLIGQVSKNVKAMLEEGIPADTLRDALVVWQRKNLNPSTLPSIVHELQSAPEEDRRPEWMR